MSNEYLWVEKYRPQTIDDTILPKKLKQTFQKIVEGGELPNMLFTGTAGLGKTTVAKALCNLLNCDYILINGSEEGNIDTLRTKIKQFASSVSLSGDYKVVILDEADYLNPQSTQPALRAFIEEFEKHCTFILTCNYANSIISPLHSRCQVIDFKVIADDKQRMAGAFMRRIGYILDEEKIEYDKKVVAEVIMKHFPDNRRVLNELQKYSSSGKIDAGILSQVAEVNLKELMWALKEKKFNDVRKWVADNVDNDPQKIFRKIYDVASEYVQQSSIPQLILILADYQYKSAFAADQELNLVACLTEVMVECQFN